MEECCHVWQYACSVCINEDIVLRKMNCIQAAHTLSIRRRVLATHAPIKVLSADGVDHAGAGAVEQATLDAVGRVHANHLLLAPTHMNIKCVRQVNG